MSQLADRELPVVVIGAGPVGLAAIAHLLERDISAVLLEAGESAGTSFRAFGHVQLFSPWRYNVDEAMSRRLARVDWHAPPPDQLPFARDVVSKVLDPFVALPEIRDRVRFNSRVLGIARLGFDKVKSEGRQQAPFVLRVATPEGEEEILAKAVIDASGTWAMPNPLGASGLPAMGEEEATDQIAYGIPDVLGPDRERYAGKRTAVVGSGHSAANALLALGQLAHEVPGTAIVWVVRGKGVEKAFGGGSADALPARGQLGSDLHRLVEGGQLQVVTGFRLSAVTRRDGRLTLHSSSAGVKAQLEDIDEVICATGQRPNLAMLSELRLKLDSWLESAEALGPLIDPNVHSCGTVRPHGHRELAHPEPGFYIIGVKAYGRAPTFLMTTGFEQARSVVAAIAGDLEAADRVELNLPETGVCGVTPSPSATACCGAVEVALATTETVRSTGGCASSCGTRPVAKPYGCCS